MPDSEPTQSFMDSKEQLQALRDKLNAINAPVNPGVGSTAVRETIADFLEDTAQTNPESLSGLIDRLGSSRTFLAAEQQDATKALQDMARYADLASTLASNAFDAGRLDALLSKMQKTNEESAELVGRAKRVRERLKGAAA